MPPHPDASTQQAKVVYVLRFRDVDVTTLRNQHVFCELGELVPQRGEHDMAKTQYVCNFRLVIDNAFVSEKFKNRLHFRARAQKMQRTSTI